MRTGFPVPVVAVGPGSQSLPEDEAPDCSPMPQEMHTYAPPPLPETTDRAARDEALRLLRALWAAMQRTPFGSPDYPVIELGELSPGARALVNDALGQGEVSALVEGEPTLRVQESVFAGVWRVQALDAAGRVCADRIEACAIPAAVAAGAAAGARRHLDIPEAPPGVMNAQALLAELRDAAARHKAGGPAHVMNFTLLPLVPDDLAHLMRTLGNGRAVVLARGYGNCRITSTALADTWWVQYYNSSDSLILNTIEVVTVPEVACASAEDYADSIERLGEWIEAFTAT